MTLNIGTYCYTKFRIDTPLFANSLYFHFPSQLDYVHSCLLKGKNHRHMNNHLATDYFDMFLC